MNRRFYEVIALPRRHMIVALALVMVLSVPVVPSYAREKTVPGAMIGTVAVMPFGTSSVPDLSVDITDLVMGNLQEKGFGIVPKEELDGFLISRRIRGAEFLSRPVIRAMGTTLNADSLLTGSVDILRGGENPQVSISVQMVDCGNGGIIWANSMSRTGADYVTFLGLGKITSLDRLVRTVLEELLDGIPINSSRSDLGPAPFEITEASFSPSVIRGERNTRLSLQVKEILGKVRDVRAFVMDKEIILHTEDGKNYSAAFEAPSMEGTYALRVYVTDRWNRLFTMDAMATLRVRNRVPEIFLSVRNRRISPNDDGVRDYALFVPEVTKTFRPNKWRVEVVDTNGRTVRTERGFGSLPEGFTWRGENDEFKKVDDGTYFCRLIVEDAAGNKTFTPEEEVVVDTKAPKVSVELREVNEKYLLLAQKTAESSGIGYWVLTVYKKQGEEVADINGKGPMSPTLRIDIVSKKKSSYIAMGGAKLNSSIRWRLMTFWETSYV